nr:prolyl 4-hydroxylase subunit alpha-2-like [Procambarus clarkii]
MVSVARVVVLVMVTVVETTWSLGDVHTSAVTVAQLVEAENSVIHVLQDYVDKEEARLRVIRQYIGSWRGGQENYLQHPINSYHLLRRLTHEFDAVQAALNDSSAEAVRANLGGLRGRVELPSEVDVNGAAYALVRLQYTYNLSLDDLVEGDILGNKAIQMLSADDCLRISQQSFNNLEFELSDQWYQKGLDILRAERPLARDMQLRIDQLIKQKDHRAMMRNLVTNLAKGSDESILEQFSGLGVPTSFQKKIYENDKEFDQVDKLDHFYRVLCRGGFQQPPEAYIGLKCGYVRGKNGYRRLMPFKAELLWADPIIVVYHDVLSEGEMTTMREIATPRLATTMVHAFTSHNTRRSLARVGKTAWVMQGEDATVDRVLRRIEDMTGLTTETAEYLHVLNYGIGGHYDAHVDFFDLQNKSMDKTPHQGDRLATMLFYLNEVEAGGSTVFPMLGLEVPPTAGSALFWFNIKRSGLGDYSTVHAACPVLLGEKWIANLWIHEFGQEFRWPCTLDPED